MLTAGSQPVVCRHTAAANGNSNLALRRLPYIDALRGWAILLVLVCHTVYGQTLIQVLAGDCVSARPLALDRWLVGILSSGNHGVQLFFVVSALSLTLSWYARGVTVSAGIRDYFWRRFCRIAPMYYCGIILYFLLFDLKPHVAPNLVNLFANIALLHGFWPPAFSSVVPGGWSVAVECVFYLSLPFLIRLIRHPRLLWFAAAGTSVAAFVMWKLATHYGAPPLLRYGPSGWPLPIDVWTAAIYFSFPNNVPVFLFGLAAARAILVTSDLGLPQRVAPWEYALAPALFLFMVLVIPFAPLRWVQPHIVFGAAAAVLCAVLHRAPSRILVNGPMAYLGKISFSIYLLHFALLAPAFHVAQTVMAQFSARQPDTIFLAVYTLLVAAFCVPAASLTYMLIESPFMRLRAPWEVQPAQAAVAAVP